MSAAFSADLSRPFGLAGPVAALHLHPRAVLQRQQRMADIVRTSGLDRQPVIKVIRLYIASYRHDWRCRRAMRALKRVHAFLQRLERDLA